MKKRIEHYEKDGKKAVLLLECVGQTKDQKECQLMIKKGLSEYLLEHFQELMEMEDYDDIKYCIMREVIHLMSSFCCKKGIEDYQKLGSSLVCFCIDEDRRYLFFHLGEGKVYMDNGKALTQMDVPMNGFRSGGIYTTTSKRARNHMLCQKSIMPEEIERIIIEKESKRHSLAFKL